MTTRGSGFTLIELLVVVAILGIISAIGIVSYNGYVSSAKKKSAENIMMQIGLAQTEYYSDNSQYYTTPGSSPTNCSPSSTTSTAIEDNLLSKADLITDEIGFEICIHEASAPSNFKIVAKQTSSNCIIRVDGNQSVSRENC